MDDFHRDIAGDDLFCRRRRPDCEDPGFVITSDASAKTSGINQHILAGGDADGEFV